MRGKPISISVHVHVCSSVYVCRVRHTSCLRRALTIMIAIHGKNLTEGSSLGLEPQQHVQRNNGGSGTASVA